MNILCSRMMLTHCLLTVILVFSVLTDVKAEHHHIPCRDGWVSANGNCYLFSNTSTTFWTMARQFCDRSNFGSKLLVVQTYEERQWIDEQISEFPEIEMWWTGYKGVDQNGIALETGDEPPVSNVTLPFVSEPDNANGNENCVVFDDRGYMRDVNCNTRNKVICEVKKAKITTRCPYRYRYRSTESLLACYYQGIYDKLTTRQGGLELCQSIEIDGKKGQLLSIGSSMELSLIQSKFLSRSFGGGYWYWIGLKRSNQGSFVYDDKTNTSTALMPWLDATRIAGDKNVCLRLVSGMHLAPSPCYGNNVGYICKQKEADEHETQCPDYWLRGGDSCYFPSYDRLSWGDALEACAAKGAHLLKTDSSVERTWLDSIEIWGRPAGYFKNYWTGLNNIKTNETYTWHDDTPYDKNLVPFPRGYMAFTEGRCTALYYYTNQIRWVDCNSQLYTACQYKRDSSQGCLDGWTSFQHNCYKSIQSRTIWESALVQCRNDVDSKSPNSGIEVNYLTLENTDQLDFVKKLTSKNFVTWLGLNDRDAYGVPQWANSNATVDSDVVKPVQEPDNPFQEQCVAFNKGGMYTTENCDAQRYYICELEKSWGFGGRGGAVGIRASSWSVYFLMALFTYLYFYV